MGKNQVQSLRRFSLMLIRSVALLVPQFRVLKPTTLVVLGVAAQGLALSGCGSTRTINLKTTAPAPQAPAPQQADPNSGNPGGQLPGGDTPITPDPVTTVMPQNGTRLVCVYDPKSAERIPPGTPDSYPKSAGDLYALSTVSTSAHAGGRRLDLTELGPGVKGPITKKTANIENLYDPVLVGIVKADTVLILAMGDRYNPSSVSDGVPSNPDKLYLIMADVSYGVGEAKAVSALVTPASGATSLARSIDLRLKPYGASIQGQFAIIPGGGGFRVLSTASFKDIGSLPLSPTRTFNLQIDESSSTLAALVYTGSTLEPVIYHVSTSKGRVTLLGQIAHGAGAISAPPATDGRGGWVWAELNSSLTDHATIVHIDANGKATRTFLKVPGKPGQHIFPQVAPYELQGNLVYAVAFERVFQLSDPATPYNAESRVATVSQTGQLLGLVDAPMEVLSAGIQFGTLNRKFMISSLLSLPGKGGVYLNYWSRLAFQNYSLNGSVISLMTQQTCSQPTILELVVKP